MAIQTAFAEQIRAFARSVDERANNIVSKIVFDVSSKIVYRSPVGDPKFWKSDPPPGYVGGRFRANWQYATDHINKATPDIRDKAGDMTLGKIREAMPEQMIGHVHYITNSLPYAIPLENGHSQRQAPAGVVGVTVLEFEPTVRAAAAEFSK